MFVFWTAQLLYNNFHFIDHNWKKKFKTTQFNMLYVAIKKTTKNILEGSYLKN